MIRPSTSAAHLRYQQAKGALDTARKADIRFVPLCMILDILEERKFSDEMASGMGGGRFDWSGGHQPEVRSSAR
jgi:hypothetical protein